MSFPSHSQTKRYVKTNYIQYGTLRMSPMLPDYRFRKKRSNGSEAAALAIHNYRVTHGHEPLRKALAAVLGPSDPGPVSQEAEEQRLWAPTRLGRGAPQGHLNASLCFTSSKTWDWQTLTCQVGWGQGRWWVAADSDP